jgi:hypothetical protein
MKTGGGMNDKFALPAILMTCVFFIACDLFIDEKSGNDFDNVAACQDLEDSMNALDCVTTDFDYSCDSFDGNTCNYTEYFSCLADMYHCDGDLLDYDSDKMQECTDLVNEIGANCDSA